ncbi:hypothetical protein BDP81DRAFT_35325 [Colletotrichum phormii]|uniref:Uncharacterized protein n=1 Tax=Colletotrichum phormii TaxID=359342 RepID=A0AAJ0EDS1_9PEZI|nr:uncharacterized protein BDP81DRAFT_35325 [Colletotrichum phormii]KAK1636232.1 hypothetical protein BDP81DRAFT_35325 [Colletotrichum phormii]
MSRYGLDDFLEGPEAFDYSLQSGNDNTSFRILLNYAGCHRYQSFSFEKRLQHFRTLVFTGDQLSSEELRLLLPETENLTVDVLESSRMEHRLSLFRYLAIGMVYQAMDSSDGFEPESESEIAWCRLLETILELDPAGLHHLEKFPYGLYEKGQTAFSQLISLIPGWGGDPHSLTGARRASCYRRLHRGIDAWLDALVLNQEKNEGSIKEGFQSFDKNGVASAHVWTRPFVSISLVLLLDHQETTGGFGGPMSTRSMQATFGQFRRKNSN